MTDTHPPLVTIMVPAYNHGAYVADCIESLWAQTYPNIEIIVCDDASPDDTWTILEAMAARSPVPMTLLRNATNKGVCATLNRCLAKAQGAWIAMIASDDMYLPTFVATNVAHAQGAASTMLCLHSGAWRERLDGKRLRFHNPVADPLQDNALEALALGRGYVIAPTFFTSRAVFDAVGGFDESMIYEDTNFFLRAARVVPFHYIDTPLLIKRDTPKSLGKPTVRAFLDGARSLETVLQDRPRLLARASANRAWTSMRNSFQARDRSIIQTIIAYEYRRRGYYPWALWVAALQGLLIGGLVALIGKGTAGLPKARLQSVKRRIFRRPAQAVHRPRSSP